MRPLPHVRFAHFLWKYHLQKEARVVDATVGNGKDTLFLSSLLGEKGKIYGFDIQEKAVLTTKNLLQEQGVKKDVVLFQQSHENFSIITEDIDLFIYNLGYLPGSDKSITTKGKTTVTSLLSAINKLKKGGAISLLCYVGHEEGKKEYEAVSSFVTTLDSNQWEVSKHQWLYKEDTPILFWLKASSTSCKR